MKKIIFILFLMITSFVNSKTIFAFWVDSSSETWFYSSIADNINKMEQDLYKIDIVWETWTKDKINKKSWSNCIKENLSIEEINYVASEWKIDLLYNKIDDSCKKDWEITQNVLSNLITSISSVNTEYKNQAKAKTNQIFNLWSTWIYSDWFEWNSPFDLIVDIQNIDSIIFMEESTIYEWNTDLDLDWEIASLVDNADELNRTPLDILNLNIINKNNNSNNQYNWLKTFDEINSNNVYSSYLCSIDNSNSWLNEDSLNFLNSDSKIDKKNIDTWTWVLTTNKEEVENKKDLAKKSIEIPFSEYSKVTDNSQFPCNTFFCIDIKFITYNHLLLGWWFQDISIEYILNRSNEHLKKFTNTSLVWSKMTINNFELGLKDLNLPDVFHIGVQISKKPIPMLYIEKEDKKEWDDDIFSVENQLKFYYESYWLEYKRQNDLSLFKKVDTDKQIALNSTLLTTSEYLKKIPDFNNYQIDKQKQKEVMHKLIENEVKTWIMSDFETQFKELEIFNSSIKDYIINLDKIISNMLKIPEGS